MGLLNVGNRRMLATKFLEVHICWILKKKSVILKFKQEGHWNILKCEISCVEDLTQKVSTSCPKLKEETFSVLVQHFSIYIFVTFKILNSGLYINTR